MPEFWRKVTVIYSGGDDFAVYGAWDALIALAAKWSACSIASRSKI